MANDWNDDLRDWADRNPDVADNLRSEIGDSLFKDYVTGRVGKLERIGMKTRAKLYKLTGLEVFHFEGYVDPEQVSIKEMLEGRQPYSALRIWLGNENKTLEGFATECEVDRASLTKFMGGDKVADRTVERIMQCLRGYSERVPEVESQTITNKTITESAKAGGLENLAGEVSKLHEQVRLLGGEYDPTLPERISSFNAAVGVLYRQAEYFANAPQGEREKLANAIDPDVWGLLTNVIGGIHKKEGGADVWARRVISGSMPKPGKR